MGNLPGPRVGAGASETCIVTPVTDEDTEAKRG